MHLTVQVLSTGKCLNDQTTEREISDDILYAYGLDRAKTDPSSSDKEVLVTHDQMLKTLTAISTGAKSSDSYRSNRTLTSQKVGSVDSDGGDASGAAGKKGAAANSAEP